MRWHLALIASLLIATTLTAQAQGQPVTAADWSARLPLILLAVVVVVAVNVGVLRPILRRYPPRQQPTEADDAGIQTGP